MVSARSIFLLISILLIIPSCSGKVIINNDIQARDEIRLSVRDYSSINWEKRKGALMRAVQYSDSSYEKSVNLLLINALDDPYPLVRIEALKGLKKMKSKNAQKKIRFMTLNDEDRTVRWIAFTVLEEYRSRENEDIFIAGYGDSDWLIREAAIRGLLKIDDEEVQRRSVELVASAINDDNISVRIEALNYVRHKDQRLYICISRLVNSRKTGISLLKAALSAISGYRFDDVTRKRLIRLVTHSNRDIRLLAFRALKKEKELYSI